MPPNGWKRKEERPSWRKPHLEAKKNNMPNPPKGVGRMKLKAFVQELTKCCTYKPEEIIAIEALVNAHSSRAGAEARQVRRLIFNYCISNKSPALDVLDNYLSKRITVPLPSPPPQVHNDHSPIAGFKLEQVVYIEVTSFKTRVTNADDFASTHFSDTLPKENNSLYRGVIIDFLNGWIGVSLDIDGTIYYVKKVHVHLNSGDTRPQKGKNT